ncbi:Y4yA family PLP-dependent enzyme [Algoriphagus sp. H41]|uniref:Y4yA family PLP-dependent enzyme n=1 Tax=Algoriphagus oliviformis TaxID=2811231 RepID=A0ABS3C2G7_9BACT|nr:Y4yA family PLP-dependent enzyme [Algoriphagus oliviformis]MBN7810794.1 Y4yA family PLP-dependent enzyme [Algoriphagus oliviformis]
MNTLPKLTPIVSPWMEDIIANKPLLEELIAEYGSPVNIINPKSMAANYGSFLSTLTDFGLSHGVFFARKANKCRAFAEQAAALGMGVDTASLQEYVQCLEMGIDPSRLIVTAAVKNAELIRQAVENGSTIILDNQDECVQVQAIAHRLGKQALVGFRLSGFQFGDEKQYSRFGFDLEDFLPFATEALTGSDTFGNLAYQGLHFHLNRYSTQERGMALGQCLDLASQLKKAGLDTKFIDIGGGFLMNYLQDQSQWEGFREALEKAMLNEIPPITFGNQGLGLFVHQGKIEGSLGVYPFWNDRPQGKFLNEVLSHRHHGGQRVGDLAASQKIEIRMEPGRSLLDQTGMTVARVAFRKRDSRGDWLVGLEMNMTQMLSGSADFLLDPFLISEEENAEEEVGVYFTGAYCLERDILLKRKVALSHLPEVGDLVAFVNTAGYMMHFFESSAHLFPLAANLVYQEEAGAKAQVHHFRQEVE